MRVPRTLLPLLLLAGVLTAGCRSAPKPAAWKLELVTDPAQPVAGEQARVRCLLTTSAGVPLDGGAAYVELARAGSPPPPQRVALAPRGNGIYEGITRLPQPGAWTATLVMTRRGRSEIRQFPLSVKPAPPGS
ncbi:MAG: FixH family protein [Terriglobales bacterium]